MRFMFLHHFLNQGQKCPIYTRVWYLFPFSLPQLCVNMIKILQVTSSDTALTILYAGLHSCLHFMPLSVTTISGLFSRTYFENYNLTSCPCNHVITRHQRNNENYRRFISTMICSNLQMAQLYLADLGLRISILHRLTWNPNSPI